MKKTLVLFTLIIANNLFAQIPTLSGKMEISIKKGTIDCDFILSDIPTVENYEILINAGLNINYFLDIQNKNVIRYDRRYNIDISEESFLYSFPNGNNDGKFIPNSIQFKYSGKFPVKSDTTYLTRNGDWKGNVAFNGKTLRMDGRQSNWYLVLYDIDNDKLYNEIKYDIDIKCNDCKSLYVNGNQPVYATSGQFKYDYPTDLLLFVGNYDFKKINNVYFLNVDIDDEVLKNFTKWMRKVKDFYSQKLKIPYDKDFNFIQTTPTFKKDAGFTFVSFPTIANVSYEKYSLKQLISYDFMKPTVAHELAHYYFGSGYKTFNSEIGNIIQESFSEYISSKAIEQVLGQKAYNEKVKAITSKVVKDDRTYIAISEIKTESDCINYYTYVYNYFPTILLAIEKEIGETTMFEWVKKILITDANITDFQFLKNTLEKTIGNKSKSDMIIAKYLTSDKANENALEKIND